MKATAGAVKGETRAIFKKPKTDKDNLKPSAKGYLAVRNGKLVDNISTFEESIKDTQFQQVFNDGKLLVEHTLSDIRARVAASVCM